MGTLLSVEQLELLKNALEESSRTKRKLIPFDIFSSYKWPGVIPWLYSGGQSEIEAVVSSPTVTISLFSDGRSHNDRSRPVTLGRKDMPEIPEGWQRQRSNYSLFAIQSRVMSIGQTSKLY
jgi:hypothetical protein